jgi:hypothetical protein
MLWLTHLCRKLEENPMPLPGKTSRTQMTDRIRGSFGMFTTSGPAQLSYLSVRLGVDHLRRLRTARQVLPREDLRIQELMQRDIDDVRVRKEIVEYLRLTPGHNDARFFPPIVVAVLPKSIGGTHNSTFSPRYPAPTFTAQGRFPQTFDANDQNFYEERVYGSAFEIRIPIPFEGASVEEAAVYHGADFGWHRDFVELLVLDGQHRLLALQAALGLLPKEEEIRGYEDCRLTETERIDLGFNSVSACIVFAPQVYEGNSNLGGVSLISLFRQIFVDVNKNARPVSRSRNVLLSQRNLLHLFTQQVLEESLVPEKRLPKQRVASHDEFPLYCFEWDPDERTESRITDPRAVSSVEVLNQIVNQLFVGGKDGFDLFRSQLNIEEGDRKIDPKAAKEKGVPVSSLHPENFSSWQRAEILRRFSDRWRPALAMLLRGLYPAERLINRLEEKRLELVKEMRRERQNDYARLALEYLLGTRSDQSQIKLIGDRNERTVGRYETAVCRQVLKTLERDFFRSEIKKLKTEGFERLFFSHLGQVQLFIFVFRTLAENLPAPPDRLSLAQAFVADFNATFHQFPKRQRLFDGNAVWNSSVINRLGTQEYKRNHVLGLFKLSLLLFSNKGKLAKLFGSKFDAIKETLSESGHIQVTLSLRARLKEQLKYSPEVTDIVDPARRDQALERLAERGASQATRKLDELLRPGE